MPKRRLSQNDENISNVSSDSASQSIRDEEDASEDLFGDNYIDDYQSIPELDTYDAATTTTNDYVMDYSETRRIEDEIERKHEEDEIVFAVPEKEEIGTEFVDKEFMRNRIVNSVCDFLLNFENKKYLKKIRKMCSENQESIYVDYADLENYNVNIVNMMLKNTEVLIRLFDSALEKSVKINYPNYYLIKQKLHFRIVNLPVIERISALRNCHLNTLVRICGIATKRTSVIPNLSVVKYNCFKCRCVFGPFAVDNDNFKPSNCLECQSKGPFSVNSNETIYKDYQKLTVQEIPGSVPAGTLPRSKDILCHSDLIDSAKPGDEVEVIGIYKNNYSKSFDNSIVFFTVIEAISIINKDSEFGAFAITEDDVAEIKKLSKNPGVVKMIVGSIAPSIYGMDTVKKAIALSMFGGVKKVMNDHSLRGDINVLLLGDPGTAKSQFLRYIEKTMHRAILTTGQGSSSVGLTASVRRDPMTKEWTLEGGALVLADKGICLIDEFDKMNDADRTSIHEAMEQQTVSISKAGIVTSLNAQCAVIAAANPTRGNYNSNLNFSQNVNLSDPIISRFDVFCVIKDIVESKNDSRMADFVLNSHSNCQIEDNETPSIISQDLLKKYILYARAHCSPKIKDVDVEKVKCLYSELRMESLGVGGIPITVRMLESIIRMSESFAKMRLSDTVTSYDIDEAISVALNSFISSQKYSVMKTLRKKFNRFFRQGSFDFLIYILKQLFIEKERIRINDATVLKVDFEKVSVGNGFVVDGLFYNCNEFKDEFKIEGEFIKKLVK